MATMVTEVENLKPGDVIIPPNWHFDDWEVPWHVVHKIVFEDHPARGPVAVVFVGRSFSIMSIGTKVKVRCG